MKRLVLIFAVDPNIKKLESVLPPLSLGIIAALTPKNWEIVIGDENIEKFSYMPADLVGISSWTLNINRAYQIADEYKENKTKVIMGGQHVTALPEEALIHADSVVKGIAEDIWPNVITDFENGELKSIYYGKPTNTFVKPRYDLFHESYKLGAIQTSRGCPMGCNYCSVSNITGHTYFRKPLKMIIEELREMPQKYIFFTDDNLIGITNKQRNEALELFETMINNNIKKHWIGQTSLLIAEDDLLIKAAKRSGCYMVFIGIETENKAGLTMLNKEINLHVAPNNYSNYIKKIQKAGIGVFAGIIYGLTTDKIESFQARSQFVRKLNLACFGSFILTPLPGTKFFSTLTDNKKILCKDFPTDWKYFDYNHLLVDLELNVSPEILYSEINKQILKTYTMYQIAYRAFRTLYQTKSILATLHGLWTNLKYKMFLSKSSSLIKFMNFVSQIKTFFLK